MYMLHYIIYTTYTSCYACVVLGFGIWFHCPGLSGLHRLLNVLASSGCAMRLCCRFWDVLGLRVQALGAAVRERSDRCCFCTCLLVSVSVTNNFSSCNSDIDA